MPDPELLNHPLYSSFPEGWTTRAVGSVLFVFKENIKIRIEEYSYLTIDVLQLKHDHGIVVTLEEEEDGDFALVSCKIQSENGKHDIKQCYDICLKIDRFLSGIQIND